MSKKIKKEFKKINCDDRTFQQIHYCALQANKTITALLAEIFTALTQGICDYENGVNLSYLYEYNYLKIKFNGACRTSVSHFKVDDSVSNEEVDRILHDRTVKRIECDLKESFGEIEK